jgi:hypothetical protein
MAIRNAKLLPELSRLTLEGMSRVEFGSDNNGCMCH